MNPQNDSSRGPAAAPTPTALTQLAAIMVSGADARSYLQGQVTADLDALHQDRAQLACCNSSQGRVQAVFWMLERSDGIALLLPATIVDSTVTRLRKYVLRAKVKIEPAPHLQVGFASHASLPAAVTLASPYAHLEVAGVSYCNLPGQDCVIVLGAGISGAATDGDREWKLSQIRAGLPQVYPETHEAFVAQMLNIDLLGGINFQKGCYTGQEIIARAHFRGTVKRRMFLFRSEGAPPVPGTRVLARDQHAGDVVDAVATAEGCELLAVVSLAQLGQSLSMDGRPAPLVRLELPYAVPA